MVGVALEARLRALAPAAVRIGVAREAVSLQLTLAGHSQHRKVLRRPVRHPARYRVPRTSTRDPIFWSGRDRVAEQVRVPA